MGVSEPLSDDLKRLAIQAQLLNQQRGIKPEEICEQILEGIRKVPDQLQMMVDTLVAMQKDFPMPKEGWEAFVRDIEYTNEKHGLDLVIKPELFNNNRLSKETER